MLERCGRAKCRKMANLIWRSHDSSVTDLEVEEIRRHLAVCEECAALERFAAGAVLVAAGIANRTPDPPTGWSVTQSALSSPHTASRLNRPLVWAAAAFACAIVLLAWLRPGLQAARIVQRMSVASGLVAARIERHTTAPDPTAMPPRSAARPPNSVLRVAQHAHERRAAGATTRLARRSRSLSAELFARNKAVISVSRASEEPLTSHEQQHVLVAGARPTGTAEENVTFVAGSAPESSAVLEDSSSSDLAAEWDGQP